MAIRITCYKFLHPPRSRADPFDYFNPVLEGLLKRPANVVNGKVQVQMPALLNEVDTGVGSVNEFEMEEVPPYIHSRIKITIPKREAETEALGIECDTPLQVGGA